MTASISEKKIIKDVEDVIKYDHGWDFAPLDMYGYPGVNYLHLEHGYIGETLTSSYIMAKPELMDCRYPWLISAQTGTGKSTFILKTLLPIALRNGKKILYLVSRKAQKLHMKKDAMMDEQNGNLRGGTSMTCKTRDYSEQALEFISEFGAISIFSYQEFLYEGNRIHMEDFLFTVMDEAHFFSRMLILTYTQKKS